MANNKAQVVRDTVLRRQKTLESLSKELRTGLLSFGFWYMNMRAVHFLKTPPEHWPVTLSEHVSSNVNAVVRADAKDVHVIRRVVDLAESKSVGDLRESALVTVLENVRRVEEILVTESADGAARAVRVNDELTESVLMQSTLSDNGGVLARRSALVHVGVGRIEDPRLGVGLDSERERAG
jgi:hypothetical protein